MPKVDSFKSAPRPANASLTTNRRKTGNLLLLWKYGFSSKRSSCCKTASFSAFVEGVQVFSWSNNIGGLLVLSGREETVAENRRAPPTSAREPNITASGYSLSRPIFYLAAPPPGKTLT